MRVYPGVRKSDHAIMAFSALLPTFLSVLLEWMISIAHALFVALLMVIQKIIRQFVVYVNDFISEQFLSG